MDKSFLDFLKTSVYIGFPKYVSLLYKGSSYYRLSEYTNFKPWFRLNRRSLVSFKKPALKILWWRTISSIHFRAIVINYYANPAFSYISMHRWINDNPTIVYMHKTVWDSIFIYTNKAQYIIFFIFQLMHVLYLCSSAVLPLYKLHQLSILHLSSMFWWCLESCTTSALCKR